MKALLSQLSQTFGLEHAALFGRGRAALVAAIEEMTDPGAPVIIPSNTCSALLVAVLASNRRPVLASASEVTGLPDDATLASAIEANRREPGLLVLTHLYGMLADCPKARALAGQCGWAILENDSLAATAGSPRECGPRATRLLSFGGGKTVDGGGGGAILTNDAHLAAALSIRASAWPVFDHSTGQIEDHIVLARRNMSAIGLAAASEPLFAVEVAQCRHSFAPDLAEPILAALHRFPDSNGRRLARLAMWSEELADVSHAISAPPIPISAAWRGLFRARDEQLRDRVVTAIREAGHDAGTNYPPLWDIAPTLVGDQRDARGDAWGQTVITLWLTDAYDQNRIRNAADTIKRAIGG